MRAISILALSNDAIRAAVIADPYSAHPTIKHFQVFPLPNGTVVDGEVVDETTVKGLLETLVKRFRGGGEPKQVGTVAGDLFGGDATFA